MQIQGNTCNIFETLRSSSWFKRYGGRRYWKSSIEIESDFEVLLYTVYQDYKITINMQKTKVVQ